MFPSVRHANTQMQLHKYRNRVWVKFADRPNICYIFEKVMVQGLKCNYTNTAWVEGDAPRLMKKYHNKTKAHKFQYGKCRIRPVYSV